MYNPSLKDLAFRAIRAGLRVPDPLGIERYKQWGRLIDLVRSLKVNIFLDVGANKGTYALRLRAAGYHGLLISFEPSPADSSRLRELSAGDPLWNICDYALGDKEETREFRINTQDSCMSSFLPAKDEQEHPNLIPVKIKRLDCVIADLVKSVTSPRMFLKMDTQGFDRNVFAGASGCLEQIAGLQSELSVVPLYETMPHFTEVLPLYELAGFELMDLFVVNRTRDGRIGEYDCFMAKPKFFGKIDARYW